MALVLTEILTSERLAALKELAARYGVKDLRVFGSYARGEARPESDLDLLVDIDYSPGVADRFLDFCEEAERLLGIKVDVLTEAALDRDPHARIFREARPIAQEHLDPLLAKVEELLPGYPSGKH